ncbi:MAG: BsuBI/PstI family type II restriction endonuclease [Gemmatimonadaceae bacterium]
MASPAFSPPPTVVELPDYADLVRLEAASRLDAARRSELGQFFTPARVAQTIASLSSVRGPCVRLLDAGAGVGSLTAAWVSHMLAQDCVPAEIEVTAFEIADQLAAPLRAVLTMCQQVCDSRGVRLSFDIRQQDFIRATVDSTRGGLFGGAHPEFDCALLNPPYRKIRSDSDERRLLRELGIETSNLYTAFVGLALRLLRAEGELVAITPRSFCNGPYFTRFRKDLLRLGSLTHVHVFHSRDAAFSDDEVLQENVVFRVERGVVQRPTVSVEWSDGGRVEHIVRREVPFPQVVRPDDPDSFIHIVLDESDTRVATAFARLGSSLYTLGIEVSTGRVVDFRARDYLRANPETGTVPLIYPTHLVGGTVVWPKQESRKPNALVHCGATENLLTPAGAYVLVKRFSAKEERRRITAALFKRECAPSELVAFENHLNYFHVGGAGLPLEVAVGLTAFLNSTLVDSFFRQFSGHTQVNATDLRKLKYPSAQELRAIAERVGTDPLTQDALDQIVEQELLGVSNGPERTSRRAERRVAEARGVLEALGLPREQQNERSALTLLALLQLRPADPWSAAQNGLCGVTPMMEFAATHYGKRWQPNTRETVRRQTVHQFVDAGLIVPNPDDPSRPINSPAYCYQVSASALALLRTYGTAEWERALEEYVANAPALARHYASEREMHRIPLRIREGLEITLSPGGQNELIAAIINEFCPRFTPGAVPIYVGDADKKWGYFDEQALTDVGIATGSHGKMPDVVVHFTEKGWLVLVEAVTSHGPINAKRRRELNRLFAQVTAPLVFVTAFLTRQAMHRYLSEIAWETEVWVADAPSHLIHFNGERFLGPYE